MRKKRRLNCYPSSDVPRFCVTLQIAVQHDQKNNNQLKQDRKPINLSKTFLNCLRHFESNSFTSGPPRNLWCDYCCDDYTLYHLYFPRLRPWPWTDNEPFGTRRFNEDVICDISITRGCPLITRVFHIPSRARRESVVVNLLTKPSIAIIFCEVVQCSI